MVARIAGFVTRADAGLRQPRSVSRNITPNQGGTAGHYGGPRQPAAAPGADHAVCLRTWRGWQAYHMDRHGWSDIAYTGGYCNHGFAFAGRGAGVRTAANGTNDGNQNFYAVVWIGGEDDVRTEEAYDAFEWWVNELRMQGAGMAVRPHDFFKSTRCPGPATRAHCAHIDGQAIWLQHPEPVVPSPPPEEWEFDVARMPTLRRRSDAFFHNTVMQGCLVAHQFLQPGDVDKYFGPNTERALNEFKRRKGLPADGVCDGATWERLLSWP
jgi:peptidoglycan hydrolase-like protein with peptidoglycan-binding domain